MASAVRLGIVSLAAVARLVSSLRDQPGDLKLALGQQVQSARLDRGLVGVLHQREVHREVAGQRAGLSERLLERGSADGLPDQLQVPAVRMFEHRGHVRRAGLGLPAVSR
ncbi:hypothetical protein [Alloactinosynnema sp. L-07]|nr:hypothetical protein [Alloactinosynnema sp. L-07]